MNPPTLTYWLHFLGQLAAETACLVLLAAAGQWFLRSAIWRRTLWQASLVALVALLLCEITGASGSAIGWLRSRLERPRAIQPPSMVAMQMGPAIAPALPLPPPPSSRGRESAAWSLAKVRPFC
jgi:hypothetical protein